MCGAFVLNHRVDLHAIDAAGSMAVAVSDPHRSTQHGTAAPDSLVDFTQVAIDWAATGAPADQG